MEPNLVSCPSEIIENIAVQLELDDIRSLRLTCRSLALKSSGFHFKTFFFSKTVELTEASLRAFAYGTSQGGLRSLAQEIILIGITDDTQTRALDAVDIPAEDKVKLLCQAFDGLKTFGQNGRLKSLSLRVAVADDGGGKLLPGDARKMPIWPRVWKAAADTFNITMRVLTETRLPVDNLTIFNDPDLQRCSLACDQLNQIDWTDPRLAESLASLQSLSISLSNRVLRFYKGAHEHEAGPEQDSGNQGGYDESSRRDVTTVRAEAQDNNNFDGLAKFISLVPHLKDFEMHYFRILSPNAFGFPTLEDFGHERLLQEVVKLEKLPVLRRCKLRGVAAREADLLSFITRTAACDLSMESVFLCSGLFGPVFIYCASEEAKVAKFRCNSVYQHDKMILFVRPEEAALLLDPFASGTELLEREGEDVKQPIAYNILQRTQPRPARILEWLTCQRKEYGPV